MRDVDGVEDSRRGTISVFDGPEPIIRSFDSAADESAFVASWIRDVIDNGAEPDEIAVFVRTDEQNARARDAVKQAGQKALMLTDRPQEEAERVMVGTMHLAKGLEFKAVAVMACDDDVLPLQERIETASDEAELEERSTTPSATCSTSPAPGRGIRCWSPASRRHPSFLRT